ncbi:hypothetical protein ABPG75_000254 [Micractinium tetrahymenae]
MAAATEPVRMFASLQPVSRDLTNVGYGSFSNSQQDGTFNWSLSLRGVAGATKAHLHRAPFGQVGPVAVVLAPAEGTQRSHLPPPLNGDADFSGSFTEANFIDFAGLDAFMALVANNTIYATIHTESLPNGALRGQVSLDGQPPFPFNLTDAPPPPAAASLPPPVASAHPPASSPPSLPPPVVALAPTQAPAPPRAPPPPRLSTPIASVSDKDMRAMLAPGPNSTSTAAVTLEGDRFGWTFRIIGIKEMTMGDSHIGFDQQPGGTLSGDQSFEGFFTPADFYGPLKGRSADEFAALATDGQLFVNVHTLQDPTSAISGQLLPLGVRLDATLAPGAGSANPATGSFALLAAPDGSFAWQLGLKDMQGLTMVHIHNGAPTGEGAALLVGLLPLGSGNSHAEFDPPVSGSDLSFSGNFTAAEFFGPLSSKSANDFMQLADAGQLYVNVHSVTEEISALSGLLGRPLAPSPPAPAPPSGGSSVPIGAIVGGVAGGIDGASSVFKSGASAGDASQKLPPSPRPSSRHAAILPISTVDTFLIGSKLTHSYPHTAPGSHLSDTKTPSKGKIIEGDPLLEFISSRLSKRSAKSAGGRSAGGGSSISAAASFKHEASGHADEGCGPACSDVALLGVKWSDLKVERSIGSGSFGRVFLAKYCSTPVAVKVLVDRENLANDADSLTLPPSVMRSLEEETRVMSRIRHPNVLSLMGLCERLACIITEYCSRGRQGPPAARAAARLTWKMRLGMAIDAATGMLFLHSRSPPIIHRDLKSPNLLVDKHYTLKVGDFNLSKILEGQQLGTSSASGSSMGGALNPIWLAPEVVRGDRALPESEIYSFGVILYELLTWQLPWGGMAPFKIMQAVLAGQRPVVPPLDALPGPDGASFAGLDSYMQLMRDCWADSPAERPIFDAIIARLEDLLPLARRGPLAELVPGLVEQQQQEGIHPMVVAAYAATFIAMVLWPFFFALHAGLLV